jgi:hypothetical protein
MKAAGVEEHNLGDMVVHRRILIKLISDALILGCKLDRAGSG